MTSMESDLQKAIYAYVAHLASTAEKGTEKEESLGVALTLLKTGFGLEGEVAPSSALLELYQGAMSEEQGQGPGGAGFPDLTKMLDPKMLEQAQKMFAGLGEGMEAGAADAAGAALAADAKPAAAAPKPAAASSATAPASSDSDDIEWTENMEKLFQKFLKTITKNGFFLDEKPGSEGYQLRYERAKAKFKQKMIAKAKAKQKKAKKAQDDTATVAAAAAAAGSSAAASAAKSSSSSSSSSFSQEEENKQLKLADECKAEGNGLLGSGNHAAALRLYDRAIALLPLQKGKSSPAALKAGAVYRSNRACALSHLGRHEEALSSAVEATELCPTYAKAYTRKGHAEKELGRFDAALKSFKKCQEVEGNSSSRTYKNAAEYIREIERARSGAAAGAQMPNAAAGTSLPPGLAGLMGAAGGAGGGLSGLMNNPMVQQMMSNPAMMQQAMSMMQNPEMMARAQQVMQDPAAMQQAMAALGAMGGAASPGRGAPGQGN